MLTTRYKSTFEQVFRPLARLIVRFNVDPSWITVSGLAAIFLSCLWVLQTKRLLVFCVLVTLAALLDAVDGAVARASGKVTKFGAYLDAVCDRYAEACVVVSVAFVTGYWLLSTVVLVGALMVSYAKARAAMEVPVANLEWPDLMERAERGVVYIVGLAVSQVVPWRPLGRELFWWTLVLLSILIHATVLQRAWRARSFIRLRG